MKEIGRLTKVALEAATTTTETSGFSGNSFTRTVTTTAALRPFEARKVVLAVLTALLDPEDATYDREFTRTIKAILEEKA